MRSERKRRHLDDHAAAIFVYTGQENVPDGVIRVRVHPSIKVIRARAFFRQRRLISAELHDGLEVIEEYAFEECRSLHEILFPPSVRAIGAGAFYNCSGLATVILNDGLEEIGERAFQYCKSLREMLFPPSVRAIKGFAFFNCSGLTTVILKNGLEEIGNRAFYNCWSLVRIDVPPSVRAIKDWAFNNCSGLATAILNDGLEEIGERAFAGCALVRIDIPPSVRAIEEGAFSWCSGLTTAILNYGLEEIGKGAFSNTSLVQIDIPPNVRTIHAKAPPPASKRPGRRNRLPRPVLGNDEYTHARRRAPGRGYVRARPSPRGGPSPFRWSRAPSTSAQCVASWRRPIVRMPGPDWQSRWSRILAFLPKRRRTRMRLHCCTFLQREKYLDLL